MDWITIIGFAAAFCTTASFLPQAIKTVRTKNTSGISLYMYILFTAGTFLWMLFGIFSHNMPVTIANVITFGFSAAILFYKIKY